VNSVRDAYQRFRHLIHEGAKFLTIGLVGTVVTFVVANALHSLGKYVAVTIATILATALSYLGNRYWTFRHRQGQGTARDSTMFFVLNGIGLLIYYACIGLTDVAGLGNSRAWYNAALVVGTFLGTLFRFWSYRKWVWKAKDHVVAEAGSQPVLAESEDAALQAQAQDLAAVLGTAPVSHEPVSHEPVSTSGGRHRR
jgi:putative flippase GtrA